MHQCASAVDLVISREYSFKFYKANVVFEFKHEKI